MRFGDFKLSKDLLAGIAYPSSIQDPLVFADHVHGIFNNVDIAAIATQVIDIKEDVTSNFNPSDPVFFWESLERYPQIKNVAIRILSMFGSTYVCGLGFSRMNFIKNKNRSRLTDAHLNQLMRITMTDVQKTVKRL
eukprot:gene2157-17747_t